MIIMILSLAVTRIENGQVKMSNFKELKTEYDKQGMYEKIVEFPDQLQEGFQIGKNADLPKVDISKVKNIVVCGLGGSAIGGDLVRTFLAYRINIPFSVCRHYTLPEYVGSDSLCILSSYSGNTEETLSAYQDAKSHGAQVFAITSGGKLKDNCDSDGFSSIIIPPGFPPRAALGYSFMPMLVILSRLGLFENIDSDIEAAIDSLEQNVDKYLIDDPDFLFKSDVLNLQNKMIIVYGGQDYFDAVAVRFKGQICENAKVPAFLNFFPEFNHNELVGWGLVDEFKDKLAVVILRDQDDHERIKLRMDIVKDILLKKGVEVIIAESSGPNLLARMFSLIQFGDFVSLYLALLNKIDPTPVEVIDFLKNELEKL